MENFVRCTDVDEKKVLLSSSSFVFALFFSLSFLKHLLNCARKADLRKSLVRKYNFHLNQPLKNALTLQIQTWIKTGEEMLRKMPMNLTSRKSADRSKLEFERCSIANEKTRTSVTQVYCFFSKFFVNVEEVKSKNLCLEILAALIV